MKTIHRYLACGSAVLLLTAVVLSQPKVRIIDNQSNKKPNEPISVTYHLGDQPFSSDNKTNAGSEWLRHLVLNVKNNSQKTIVYFYIQLLIEKQGTMPIKNAVALAFPNQSDPVLDAAGQPTGERKVPILKPGETVKIAVPEKQWRFLEDYLKEMGVVDLRSLSLDIRYVYYQDGTRWVLGKEVRQNPFTNKWVPIDADAQKPTFRKRFSSWLKTFVLVDASQSFHKAALIHPVPSLFFSAIGGASATSPPVQTTGCRWFQAETDKVFCLGYCIGTNETDRVCKYPRDYTYGGTPPDPENYQKGHLEAVGPNPYCAPDFNLLPVPAGDACAYLPEAERKCGAFVKYDFVAGSGNGCSMCEDKDGDGHSTCYDGTCSPACDGDCNDDPNAGGQFAWSTSEPEVCDGADNNCNGNVDEGFDPDNDGYFCSDCQPNDGSIPGNPLNAEMCELPCEDVNCIDDEEWACDQIHERPVCDTGTVWKWCVGQNGCCVDSGGNCPNSPILIDIDGDGFSLTNAANGVDFDFSGQGPRSRTAWTSSASDDAWLFLDRNGNRIVDDGTELFGNFTKQPIPNGIEPNGFIALNEFDKLVNGGNGDNEITVQDAVFATLRLWQDANHNGTSESGELKTLSHLGLAKIELKYHESKTTDQYGNKFKYRAKVKDPHGAQVGRWAYDVFLVAN